LSILEVEVGLHLLETYLLSGDLLSGFNELVLKELDLLLICRRPNIAVILLLDARVLILFLHVLFLLDHTFDLGVSFTELLLVEDESIRVRLLSVFLFLLCLSLFLEARAQVPFPEQELQLANRYLSDLFE
jgi:hypothetical protein